jgi:hypothetical protein
MRAAIRSLHAVSLAAIALAGFGCAASIAPSGADGDVTEASVLCTATRGCPTVAITSPLAGAAVHGQVTVTGTAADDGSILRVKLSVDGGPWILASGTTSWSAPLDTTSLANGPHTLTARAVDDRFTFTEDSESLETIQVVSGLMLRSGVPPTGEESFITSSVLALYWDELEPSPGSFDWTTLDEGLAKLAAAGVGNVKIRVFSGGTAPPWVKRLGSQAGYFNSPYGIARDCSPSVGAIFGGVAVQNVQGPTACIPFFWTAAYQQAYDALMKALAARLDGDASYDAVTTIVDSSCMAVYAEVFYRGQSDGATNHTLADAGLTPTSDWACQAAAIHTHKNAFGARRRTALAINNWDLVQPTPQANGSYHVAVWSGGSVQPGTYEFVEQVARPTIGTELLELQNNGLHSTSSCDGSGPTGSYFCYLAAYAGRHGFQTQSYQATPLSRSGASQTLLDDLVHGLAMNAQFIELPGGMSAADWKLMPCFDAAVRSGSKSACPE